MEDDEARDSAAVFPSPNPTRPPTLLCFRATRRGFGAGHGAGWWCLMASWIFWLGVGCARARLGEVWKTRRGGDLLRAGWRFGLRTSARPAKIAHAAAPTDLDGRVGRPWNPLHLGGLASAGARLATARRAPPHAARSRPSLPWGRAADGRHAACGGRNVVRRPDFGYPPPYLP